MKNQMQVAEVNNPNFMTYNGNHLFHYTKFESALNIIISHTLLFGDFRSMNDISESRREIYDEVAIKEMSKYKSISLTKDEKGKRGFEIDSLWGYYAEKGNGACLVFDKEKLVQALNSLHCFHKDDEILYIVNFSNAPFLPDFKDPYLVAEEIERRYFDLFYTKSEDWRLENEYRLLVRYCKNNNLYLDFKDALMAVIICMPLCESIETSNEYNILKSLTGVPILHYSTKIGNKTLTDIRENETLWPLESVDYEIDASWEDTTQHTASK